MHTITNLIDEGDWCGLLFVAIVLAYVGAAMVRQRPTTSLWGIRISATSFVVFAVKRTIRYGIPATEDLVAAVLYGLLSGAIVLGPAWIILAIAAVAHEHWRTFQDKLRRRADDRKSRREHRKRQQSLERDRTKRQHLAPDRTIATREASERQRVLEDERRTESRRREDARVACELLYALREPDICGRYPLERFLDFLHTYLGDDKSVDVVERRAGELQTLIQQHYEAINPPEKFRNLAELTVWYEEQLTLVDSLSIAIVYKRDFQVQLNDRYSELTARLMESL